MTFGARTALHIHPAHVKLEEKQDQVPNPHKHEQKSPQQEENQPWKCRKCGIFNDGQLTRCISCECWTCDSCSIPNPLETRTCIICGNIRLEPADIRARSPEFLYFSIVFMLLTLATFVVAVVILSEYMIAFKLYISFGFSVFSAAALSGICIYLCFSVKKKKYDCRIISLSPLDEADQVTRSHIYLLSAASFFLCLFWAIPMITTYSNAHKLSEKDTFGPNVLFLTIQSSGIVAYLFHRVLRPSDRDDPLRTMLELDAVDVCLDSLDSADLFTTYTFGEQIPEPLHMAVKSVIGLWMLTVAVRLALLFLVHSPDDSRIWTLFGICPGGNTSNLTVNRATTAAKIRVKSGLLLLPVEILALSVRVAVLCYAGRNDIQFELAGKNVMGIWRAFAGWRNLRTNKNLRKGKEETGFFKECLAENGCFKRFTKRMCALWSLPFNAQMCVVHIVVSVCTIMLVIESQLSNYVLFVYFFDVVVAGYIIAAPCRFRSQTKKYTGLVQGEAVLMWIFLLSCITTTPLLFYSSLNMTTELQLYPQLVFILAVLPTALVMSASSLKSNILDPSYSLVQSSIFSEIVFSALSALDLFSTGTLQTNLHSSMRITTLAFAIFELLEGKWVVLFLGWPFENRGNWGGLEMKLGSPAWLVRCKATVCQLKIIVDLGSFIVRLILWQKFGILTSVFLMKNTYNILHTFASVERALYKHDNYVSLFKETKDDDWRM